MLLVIPQLRLGYTQRSAHVFQRVGEPGRRFGHYVAYVVAVLHDSRRRAEPPVQLEHSVEAEVVYARQRDGVYYLLLVVCRHDAVGIGASVVVCVVVRHVGCHMYGANARS